MGRHARKSMLELLNENREKRKALDVKIAEQEAALTRERDKAASKLMNTAGIETAEQLRDMICFAQFIMARLSRQKSDDFIVNQAAAFAASSNMAGKYASAGGMSPIAEWQRS